MKLRVIDRLLIALSGLILLALAVYLALSAVGVVFPATDALVWLMGQPLLIAVCIVLALLGVYEVSVLFRRKKGKRSFIAQKSENGQIEISVKSIESLVFKCAQKHGEIQVQSVSVEEARDGLIIKLRAALANGMNIPLAVGTLQKQIKQYITACSGVDVSEVCVKVDSTDRTAENSPYAVSEAPAGLPVEEPEPSPTPAEAVTPVELPEEEPIKADAEEAEERLIHQRLFSVEEEPAVVPEPPMPEPETVVQETVEESELLEEAEPEEEPAPEPAEEPEEEPLPEEAQEEPEEPLPTEWDGERAE